VGEVWAVKVQTVRVRDLDHAVDLFEGELARRGRKPATRQKYRDVLYPFCEACGDIAPWEVTPDHCRVFLDRWVNAAPSTLALYVSILNRFFCFLHDEEIIEVNPMQRIRRPPLRRPEELDVTTISSEDVERLYAAAKEWDEILCLAVLTYLGPRRSAAANLRLSDVDFERGTMRFKEKGGKVITKPMPDELVAILHAADDAGVWGVTANHMSGDAAPTAPPPSDAYVIPNRRAPRNRQRSNKVIYAIVKRIAERAGVDVHPHALRAAFAVHFLESNPGDTEALQKLMGHTRMETTQVYLRRHDTFKVMERVRGLSWGAAALQPSADMPPAGFEPAFQEDALPEQLRSKLAQLRARNSRERA
jgi:integrase